MLLLTDEAREFVGKVLGGLTAALGVEHITTRAYNPRANGLCERVHEFLGECLTRLSEEERSVWERRTEDFAFAHNTTVQDAIGCTPFELGHGSAARTLVTGAALGVSSLEKCAAPSEDEVRGYYGRVKAAASVFSEVASRVMKDAREAQNARLNEGSRAREFAVGDIVSIYCPSSGIDSKWKPKHKIKWRGPMEVVSRLSATAYGMRELSSGQYFERTVCMAATSTRFVRRWIPELGRLRTPRAWLETGRRVRQWPRRWRWLRTANSGSLRLPPTRRSFRVIIGLLRGGMSRVQCLNPLTSEKLPGRLFWLINCDTMKILLRRGPGCAIRRL